MSSLLINGANIKYEEMGAGTPIALTPGGRAGREGVRPLAQRLASHYRVIIYDRRNCGASDVVIDGELSEQEIWADDLYELLKGLKALPAYVGGISAGCRVSLLLAIRHPEAVKGLLLWWVTGGAVAAERLGYTYYEQFIEMAARGGMQEVIASEFFAERIRENPSNRQRLLAMNPQRFIEIMRRWRAFFTADKPVIGATETELRAIRVPAAIIPGNDEIHPKAVGENLHRLLLRSELFPHPWEPGERELLAQQDPQKVSEVMAERLASVFLPFLAKMEKAQVSIP